MTAKTELEAKVAELRALASARNHTMDEGVVEKQRGGYLRWEGHCTKCKAVATATTLSVYGLPCLMGIALKTYCK